MLRAHNSLALLTAAASISVASAAPPCDSIDFDGIPPNVVFTGANQPYAGSKGVTFSSTCGNPSIASAAFDPSLVPPSQPQALAGPQGDPLTDCCMSISFDSPQNWARFHVAASLLAVNSPTMALDVTAYDFSNGVLGSTSVTLTNLQGAISPNPQVQWAPVLFDMGVGNCVISRIDICVRDAGLMFQFFVDDLEWGNDQSKPVVFIDEPAEEECLCDGHIFLNGSACDDGCGDLEGELRIRPIVSGATSTSGSPPWVPLASLLIPQCLSIPGLVATTLPAGQFPEGRYLLQLEATDECGRSDTDERVVLVDRRPPVISITCPTNGQIVNKKLDIVGSITDLCLRQWSAYFGPHPSSTGYPLIASGTTNVGPVITSINTTAYADGQYQLRVRAADMCNRGAWEARTVIIDNTPPIAEITTPDPCLVTCQSGTAFVMGFIDDAHLAGWKLEFKMGSDPATPGISPPWITIATGSWSVGNAVSGTPGLIAIWDQCGLPNCCYQLRLTAWDSAGSCPSATSGPVGPNVTVDEMCANLGLNGDTNGDGVIDNLDVLYLIGNWGPCPSCP